MSLIHALGIATDRYNNAHMLGTYYVDADRVGPEMLCYDLYNDE